MRAYDFSDGSGLLVYSYTSIQLYQVTICKILTLLCMIYSLDSDLSSHTDSSHMLVFVSVICLDLQKKVRY